MIVITPEGNGNGAKPPTLSVPGLLLSVVRSALQQGTIVVLVLELVLLLVLVEVLVLVDVEVVGHWHVGPHGRKAPVGEEGSGQVRLPGGSQFSPGLITPLPQSGAVDVVVLLLVELLVLLLVDELVEVDVVEEVLVDVVDEVLVDVVVVGAPGFLMDGTQNEPSFCRVISCGPNWLLTNT
jgi:hypothetical protein